jgi:hypothetical protein
VTDGARTRDLRSHNPMQPVTVRLVFGLFIVFSAV